MSTSGDQAENDEQARIETAATPGQLPEWCNVYEGLTDAEIAEIEASIIRDGQ